MRSATVSIFRLCSLQNSTSCGTRDMVPSSLMISQMTLAGVRPAIRARSTDASVWPARTSTPPLRAPNGGVLVRAGQTEASVDLARIAGLTPASVICEIMSEDGTMSRVPQLVEFCKEHNLKMLTVADLIRYRMQHERYVRRVAEAVLPTRFGGFRMIAYASDVDHDQHIALVRGDLEGAEPALVRVHSHCLTGDVFGSTACDCSELVSRSLETIAKEDRGVFLY